MSIPIKPSSLNLYIHCTNTKIREFRILSVVTATFKVTENNCSNGRTKLPSKIIKVIVSQHFISHDSHFNKRSEEKMFFILTPLPKLLETLSSRVPVWIIVYFHNSTLAAWEAVIRRCSKEQLMRINLQYSQENTFDAVHFYNKVAVSTLQIWWKRVSITAVFQWGLQTFFCISFFN